MLTVAPTKRPKTKASRTNAPETPDPKSAAPDQAVRGLTLGEITELDAWVEELRAELQRDAGDLNIGKRAVTRNGLLVRIIRRALDERRRAGLQ